MSEREKEEKHIEIFLEPIRKCKEYKPKFGESQNERGVTREEFIKRYGEDPFYSWIGLNSGLMYAAHKAAGGMTSIYRQIGVGCERLFKQIIIDAAQYEDESFASWSYEAITRRGETKKLSLDGRLELAAIRNAELKKRLQEWIDAYCEEIDVKQPPNNGVVFEVRQGYKSKDSKRQNADIDNATVAWANGYLPIFAIFSAQIDSDLLLRYRNKRCGIIIGAASDDSKTSLFAFTKNILGYDLAGFFERNSANIRDEIHLILKSLLDAN